MQRPYQINYHYNIITSKNFKQRLESFFHTMKWHEQKENQQGKISIPIPESFLYSLIWPKKKDQEEKIAKEEEYFIKYYPNNTKNISFLNFL